MRYLWIYLWSYLAFELFRKVFGLVWFYVAVPFRKYARNTVYNYVLQNDIYLKRLLERPILPLENGQYYINPYHGTNGGYIKYRKISLVEYQLVYWLIWGWLDDDANYDTFDQGYVDTILNNERMKWFPKQLLKGCEGKQFGNSFDLGDKRSKEFHFWGSTLWNIRNTAYNFKYMQAVEEPSKEMHNVKFSIFGYLFEYGWDEDNEIVYTIFPKKEER